MPTFILILRWLTLGIWSFWLIAYWVDGARLKRRAGRPVKKAHTVLDLIVIAVIVLVAQAFVWTGIFAGLERITLHPWAERGAFVLPGTLAAAAGMGGSFYARHYLGRFWSMGTSIQPGHQVIDIGPYNVVRHPIYAAMLLMYAGTALVFSAWWTWASFLLLAAAHLYKLLDEELFLVEQLPSYASYRRRVAYRLIPGVW